MNYKIAWPPRLLNLYRDHPTEGRIYWIENHWNDSGGFWVTEADMDSIYNEGLDGWGVARADIQINHGIPSQEEMQGVWPQRSTNRIADDAKLHKVTSSADQLSFDQVIAAILEGYSPASFSWETRPGRENTTAPER